MEKPKPIQRPPILFWNDIKNYIEWKYNINLRDIGKTLENNGKYCDGDGKLNILIE